MEATYLHANRLQTKPPLLYPIVGSAAMPIPIEIREPDFNKAIASVIWFRHHRQPMSTVFNCNVSNCPLCPTTAASERPSVEYKRAAELQKERSVTRRPAVVNWLIPSSKPSLTSNSNTGADCLMSSSCTSSPPGPSAKRLCRSSSPSPDQRTKVSPTHQQFQCPWCPMSFAKSSNLRVHQRSHTEGTPSAMTVRRTLRIRRERLRPARDHEQALQVT